MHSHSLKEANFSCRVNSLDLEVKNMNQENVARRLLGLERHPSGQSLISIEKDALKKEIEYWTSFFHDHDTNFYSRRLSTEDEQTGTEYEGKTFI
jgi:hypothetical protein